MSFQHELSSIYIDTFKHHYVLVFDFTSMQDATDNCGYPEFVGKLLRLKLIFSFPLDHVIELIALGERMPPVAVDKFSF